MQYTRRFVWFIAKHLILWCVILGIAVCTFYMCMNTADIYMILTDGLKQRAETILTRENAESLNFFFHADFLSSDPALEGAFDGTSVYEDYRITDIDYQLKIEKLWAWPWDNYATCTVVERIPTITGEVIPSRRNAVSASIPQWQGGRYDLTLVKVDGSWKIIGMQQKTVLIEAAKLDDSTTTNEENAN